MARILLIEPDIVLAHTFADAFSSVGHEVQICVTAQQAIMAADEARPDAVVLELQLVAHSGVEFLYEFRSYADWQGIPIIIHTNVPATEFAGSRDLLRESLGVRTYLYKPHTNLMKLLASVDESVSVK